MTHYGGVYAGSTSDRISIINCLFQDIDSTHATVDSGIRIDGNDCKAIGNTFEGIMDDFPIEIDSNANNTTIIGNSYVSITGQAEAGVLVKDRGTDTQIIEADATITNQILPSTTFYSQLTVNGTFYSNIAWCSIAVTDNATTTTVDGSTVSFRPIEVDGNTWQTATTTNPSFTFSGSSITYNGRGGPNKRFKISASISCTAGSNGTVLNFKLFAGGVGDTDSITTQKIIVSGDIYNLSFSFQKNLSESDIVQLRVSGSNSTTATIEHMNLNIRQID